MQLAFIIISSALGAAIVSFDVIFAFIGRVKSLSVINTALHPVLLISLFFAGADITALSLCAMASAALLTLSFYVRYLREGGSKK